jgi:hypothetical protein
MKWVRTILNIFRRNKPKLKSREEQKEQAIKLIQILKQQYDKESKNSKNVLVQAECSKNYLELSLIEVQLIVGTVNPTNKLITSIEELILIKC